MLCSCQSEHKATPVTCIEVSYGFPVNISIEKGITTVNYIRDTMMVFYYENFVLYKFRGGKSTVQPGHRILWEEGMDITGDNPYFFYRKNDEFGWKVKKIADISKAEKQRVDSFLFKEGTRAIIPSPSDLDFKKVQTLTDTQTGIVTEQYLTKIKRDETTPDSAYFYFDKRLNDIGYSFSPVLDSTSKMKVCRFRLMYNEYFSPTQKKIIPKKEVYGQIRMIPVENPDKIKKVFKVFTALSK